MKRLSITFAAAAMAVAMLCPSLSYAKAERAFNGKPAPRVQNEANQNQAQMVKDFIAKHTPQGQTLEKVQNDMLFDPAQTQTHVLNVSQNPKRVIKRSAEQPVGEIYGVLPTFVGASSAQDAVFAKINLDNGSWDIIYRNGVFQISQSEYYMQSSAVREGILYIPTYFENMTTGEYRITWSRFDLETGKVLEPLNFGNSLAAFFYSMTYDPKNDCFWGLSVDFSGSTGGNLTRVKCDGQPKWWYAESTGINLGPTEGEFANAITYCPLDNRIYAIRDNGQFVSIDPKTENKASVVYQFDEAENPYCFNTMYQAAPIVYSPRDKAFIGMHINSDEEAMEVYAIDAETYDSYLITSLNPTGYVATLLCGDKYAEDDAPDRVEDLKVNLVDNNLTGSFEFKMPSTTFAGIALPANNPIDVIVSVDGKTIWTGKANPGATVKETYTFQQGLHNIIAYAKLSDELKGPEIKTRFYAGNDTPFAPQDVSLEGNVLTWGEPRHGGVNGGFVDNSKATYNVYWDGTRKLNDAPLTEREFTIPEPAQQERHVVTVVTLVNDMESEPSESISRVFGPAFDLPFTMTPTNAESDLFETIDVNRDANGNFNHFIYNPTEQCWTIRDEYYYFQMNDLLFLPKIKFDNEEALYSLDFTYQGYWADPTLPNSFNLYLAKVVNSNVRSMTLIDSRSNIYVPTPENINVRFAIPEPGEYYIVFNEIGPDQKYRGAKISNFHVQTLEGFTAKAPGDMTDVSVYTDPEGKMEAVIDFTAPTVDIKGRALPSDMEIKIKAFNDQNYIEIITTPGKKGSLRLPTHTVGSQYVKVVPSSVEGEGIVRSYYAYIGLDTPTAPRNITGVTHDDNLGIALSWDAPSSVGTHNGFVDINNLTYNIYRKEGINYIPVSSVFNDYSYDYRIKPALQQFIYVGPVASNSMGESVNSLFINDVLGTPYELPMSEVFNTLKFQTQRWTQEVTGEYYNVTWETASNLSTLSLGNPVPSGGGLLYSYNTAATAAYGRMNSPKFTTVGVENASVNVRYWASIKSTSMELYARSNKDQEYKKIDEVNGRQMLGNPAWKDWKVYLPKEYLDCDWVQVAIRDYHRNDDTYSIIDSFSVINEVDYDFAVTSIDGPYSAIVGESPEFTINLVNGGIESARPDLLVELLAEDNGAEKLLQKKEITIGRINPSASYVQKVNFNIDTEAMKYDNLTVRATVSHEGDHITHNNTSTATFIVKQNALPVVTDLKGEWLNDNHQGAALTWTAPVCEWGPNEDFEVVPPFKITDRIGQWKNVDMDKGDPFYLQGCEWENCQKPAGWMVINAPDAGLTDARMTPQSGKQYLMARSIGYDMYTEEPIPACDWLISPEVKGGSHVSFWMGTVDYQYSETITIFYSTTDDTLGETLEKDEATGIYTCGSFKSQQHFTKSGNDLWEFIEFDLPADARYFAFVYRSIGQFGCMIDDIQFEPITTNVWDIDSYDVIRVTDNSSNIVANVKTPGYTDNDNNDMNATYFVTPIVINDGKEFVSPRSNPVNLYSSAVDNIFGENTFVGAGKNMILFGGLAGQDAKIFATDGRSVRELNITSDRQTVRIDSGIYLVQIGKKSVKVFVK